MKARGPFQVKLAAPAFEDIGDIWVWTVEHFGHSAALRYEALVDHAIADLADDPTRPGSKEREDLLPGLCSYHLVFSRGRVPAEQKVRSPRHLVLFRLRGRGVIEIVRILHDSCDLAQHVSETPGDL